MVYIPDPTESLSRSRKGTKGREKIISKRWVEHTAVWKWDEPGWKVVLHKEGVNASVDLSPERRPKEPKGHVKAKRKRSRSRTWTGECMLTISERAGVQRAGWAR